MWTFNRNIQGNCDICESEDNEMELYASEGNIVCICERCRCNIQDVFGIEFKKAEEAR